MSTPASNDGMNNTGTMIPAPQFDSNPTLSMQYTSQNNQVSNLQNQRDRVSQAKEIGLKNFESLKKSVNKNKKKTVNDKSLSKKISQKFSIHKSHHIHIFH